MFLPRRARGAAALGGLDARRLLHQGGHQPARQEHRGHAGRARQRDGPRVPGDRGAGHGSRRARALAYSAIRPMGQLDHLA
eukprot:13055842-Heterocapsa_arctica.AAC.1